MDSTNSNLSVKDVLKTADLAFQEYQNTTQHFATDAQVLFLLTPLILAISTVKLRLASAVNNEDVSECLEGIIVNQDLFLSALNGDLSMICTYLQDVVRTGRKPSKHEVDTCAQAIDRYSDVLEAVQNRNVRYAIC
jgi:hypothetical protein